jgi:hypothetical protein
VMRRRGRDDRKNDEGVGVNEDKDRGGLRKGARRIERSGVWNEHARAVPACVTDRYKGT